MQAKDFHLWLKDFSEQAVLLNERRLVVLSGSENWALTLLKDIVYFPQEKLTRDNETQLIYGDSQIFPANVPDKRFRDKLGSECHSVIFADSQFRIDALAALSGTIKSGGLLYVVIPELEFKKQQSQFIRRFFYLLDNMSSHAVIAEFNTDLPVTILTKKLIEKLSEKGVRNTIGHNDNLAYSCATAEQLLAVKSIEKVVIGHRKRPLVLTADRGRGKSSALAIACAQLLLSARTDNPLHIIITAPDSQSLSVFFSQLQISLPDISRRDNSFLYANSCVEFIPVDQLLKHQPKASLLLVDEAAAIPVYLLEQLLTIYHRMVFSSTVHGYEGAGRGFTLKFQQTLSQLCPNWHALHMHEPIRWRLGDPLEQFVFDACLLNSELKSITFNAKARVDLSALSCEVFIGSDLVADEDLLKQVFSILVTAHYQTKPSDVKLLLDNPNVQLVCLTKADDECDNDNDTVLAVALLLKEGCVEDVDAVINSQRRLKNHFLPQSLLTHCGFEQAFNHSYLRIMRIAVHPKLQHQGLGTHLLEHITQLASRQKVDFIGASFGINSSLLAFWLTADMQVTRIGFTKDKASGEHSVMVLKAINTDLNSKLKQLNDEFYRSFDFLLADEYKELSTDVVLLLLKQQRHANLAALTPLDLANVNAFAQGERLYSSCAYSLYLWLKHDLLNGNSSTRRELEQHSLILIARLLQKQTCEAVCQQYGLTGKKMLNQVMKNTVCLRIKNNPH